jgi:hypothetical protein
MSAEDVFGPEAVVETLSPMLEGLADAIHRVLSDPAVRETFVKVAQTLGYLAEQFHAWIVEHGDDLRRMSERLRELQEPAVIYLPARAVDAPEEREEPKARRRVGFAPPE